MIIINFIKANYEWLLSGVGTSILFYFLGKKSGYKKAIKQQLKMGNNSSAIQVAGDFNARKTRAKNR